VAQGVKVAEAYDLLAALLHLYSTKGEIFLYLGEWKEAEESFKQGLALADDLGNLERQAGYRLGLALAARGRKDLESAVRLLVEALALIGERGYWHLHTRLQIWLAEALFEQSNFVQAAQMLDPAVALAHAHQRSLLLAQGECLHAQLLAANGDWPAANDLFDGTLKIVSRLGLPLETARIQAAWGKTALHYSSAPEQSRALIDSARKVFVACDARADLADVS
jgi:tetratricopeptide (TPR) repeat protein